MAKVRVAIVGVGNCANSFLQGLNWYAGANATSDLLKVGLVRPDIGGYRVEDIEVVVAFDVAESKVGQYLTDAVWAFPNDTFRFSELASSRASVYRGPTLDGLGKYLSGWVKESPDAVVKVADILASDKVDVVINYLPVGSEQAAHFYADQAIKAGCAMVNCIPVFLASNPYFVRNFEMAGLPIIGDDIKSQVGATIVHRALARLFKDRGVHLDRTYQLNIGGNGDFLNMLERERLESKKKSKTDAVVSISGVEFDKKDVHIGPSDYVPWLGDRKIAYIRLEGRGFGGAPLEAEIRLSVWDSPNSAGIVIDAVRCAKVALDRGLKGAVLEPSAYFMKSPPKQVEDSQALIELEEFIDGRAHRMKFGD